MLQRRTGSSVLVDAISLASRPRTLPASCRRVRELANGLFEAPSLDAIGRLELVEQPRRRRAKRPAQLLQLEAPYQRSLQPVGDRGRQGVGPLRVVGGLTEAKTRKRQHLVADAADPVLRLPWLPAFDAAPGVQDVVPREPDQVAGVRRWGLGPPDRLAEDGTEMRPTRAELAGRGEAEVHLEAGRQQKCTVDRGGNLEIEVVQGTELAMKVVAPIGEHRVQRDPVHDAEEQVDVRPSVLSAVRRGAGHRGPRDARVLLGEPEQLPPQRIPMIAGEHATESSRARRGIVVSLWELLPWSSGWSPSTRSARPGSGWPGCSGRPPWTAPRR